MTSPADQSGQDWSEIEQFIAGISELAQDSGSFDDFASEAIHRTVDLLDAAGGAVWITDDNDHWRLLCKAETDRAKGDPKTVLDDLHPEFLLSIARSRQPQMTSLIDERTQREMLRFGAPLGTGQSATGVIEVIQYSPINAATRSGIERLLEMVSDLTGDFLRRRRLNELQEAEECWQRYEALSQRVHATLDLRDTAYQLVNDGRLFVGCDRASLVVPSSGVLKAVAISGVDTLDRRSDLVRSMEDLAKAVAPSRQWLRYRGNTDQLPPQLEKPVCAFADDAHSQAIDVVPLLAPSPVADQPESLVGMLILEQFDATNDPSSEERIIRIAKLSSSALRNAIDYQTLPFLSVARWMRHAIRLGTFQRRKWVIGGLLLLLISMMLWLVPATHYVEAEGEAQPLNRRNVYAPLDGEVVKVRGGHDESVLEAQVLVVLRSRALELELQELQGEYQTAEKKLLAVTSARVQSNSVDSLERYPGQLASEEQELKLQMESLQTQLGLVRTQRDQLTVRSPIAGRVLTWDPKELLGDRPVQRGQLLVSVADLDGPWIIELNVPDRRVGHVISARDQSEPPLDVSFTLATGGAPTYQGVLKQIAARTEVIGNDSASARVVVSVPSEAVKMLRPGTRIRAKFDCGQRSLGFVWLHDIFDTVRAWLLF